MATDKTRLSELATAAGLCYLDELAWPRNLEKLHIPGIADDVWQPVVLPVTATAHPQRELLLRALANGRAFRLHVLDGRQPRQVEWTGAQRTTWTSDVPRDLTVDRVYFVQAKFDSTCVLNTAPSILVDDLLLDDGAGGRLSWYEEVAPHALASYYTVVRRRHGGELPADVRDLDKTHRTELKQWMRAMGTTPTEDDAYHELCRAVSEETARRWRRRLRGTTTAQQTQFLFRMLRIAGGPYWLLGTKGAHAVQLAVTDSRSWRERFALKRFDVADAHAGQPQVNWRATIADRTTDAVRTVDGYCEIRWSHGKLQGHPECKVQVTTALGDLPGYDPMA